MGGKVFYCLYYFFLLTQIEITVKHLASLEVRAASSEVSRIFHTRRGRDWCPADRVWKIIAVSPVTETSSLP